VPRSGSHRSTITGDLEFNANGESGDGDTRMTISDLDGQVTIGGSGRTGQIQLKFSNLDLS